MVRSKLFLFIDLFFELKECIMFKFGILLIFINVSIVLCEGLLVIVVGQVSIDVSEVVVVDFLVVVILLVWWCVVVGCGVVLDFGFLLVNLQSLVDFYGVIVLL